MVYCLLIIARKNNHLQNVHQNVHMYFAVQNTYTNKIHHFQISLFGSIMTHKNNFL